MTTPTAVTQRQADIIKTAAAIIYVLDDSALHAALKQTTPLDDDQIVQLTHRFSDGLDHWDREVRQRRMPPVIEVSRIAIVAYMLDQRYPGELQHDNRGEIVLPVQDIVDAWRALTSDIAQVGEGAHQWQVLIHQTFGSLGTQPRNPRVDQSIKGAERVGKAIVDSVGLGGLFTSYLNAGEVPMVEVPPLPTYAADDERSRQPELMAQLQLDYRITLGLLQVVGADEPHSDPSSHVLKWFQDRANTAIGTVTKLVIPSGISRYSSQLQDSRKVLAESSKVLKLAIYGEEPQLASAAAKHAVERSPGTILFLAVFPNIPFIIPTIELRLAFTKPIYFLTRSAHDALGKIPIFGFPFFLLRLLGQFIDSIPQAQVRLVQSFVTEGWLVKPNQRARIVLRYLRYADRRAMRPRVDAIQRVLLSIVS